MFGRNSSVGRFVIGQHPYWSFPEDPIAKLRSYSIVKFPGGIASGAQNRHARTAS